jgi:tRNA(Ile)-lysidine synthase
MNSLLQRVQEAIRRHRVFRPGQRILVAVSGGVDSMVLLQALHQLSKANHWRLTVAHLNHQLRGRSSAADERLVRRTAQRLGLSVVVDRSDVRAFGRENKLSVEMAAREIRHAFLARTARRLRIPVVALAHHADDQIELFFLRLLRGSGSEGLGGMKWRNPSPCEPRVDLGRPLLDEPKSALRQYAVQQKLPYREDASNASREIRRNRLRHQLLPLLKRQYQPALERTILRVMDLVAAEGEVVTGLAREWLALLRSAERGAAGRGRWAVDGGLRTGPPPAVRRPQAKVQLSTSNSQLGAEHGPPRSFEGLPVAVQRRCLQLQLLEQGVVGDFELIEQLRLRRDKAICIGPANAKAPASSREQQTAALSARRDTAGLVHLEPIGPLGFKPGSAQIQLEMRAGQAKFDGLGVRWALQSHRRGEYPRRQPGREFFDAEKVGSRILLRHWQAADRFQPIGFRCPIKLQNFFTNEKVPRRQRHKLVLAVSRDGKVFWVEGMRIAERFKLTAGTRRRLQWTWERR